MRLCLQLDRGTIIRPRLSQSSLFKRMLYSASKAPTRSAATNNGFDLPESDLHQGSDPEIVGNLREKSASRNHTNIVCSQRYPGDRIVQAGSRVCSGERGMEGCPLWAPRRRLQRAAGFGHNTGIENSRCLSPELLRPRRGLRSRLASSTNGFLGRSIARRGTTRPLFVRILSAIRTRWWDQDHHRPV